MNPLEGTATQGFPSLSLALLWPGVRLPVVDELARAQYPPRSAQASSKKDMEDEERQQVCSQPLPSPVALAHLLPTNTKVLTCIPYSWEGTSDTWV